MSQSTSLSLAGKTALVTGAATGIGKAIAAALAAAGARVVVNHPHTPEPAAAVVADIAAAGGAALAVAADISDRAQYQAMVERLLGEWGRWDVLVNNAAVAVTKPFPEISEEEFDRSFAVNVKGVFHGLQLAWDHLAEGGRIITISSSTTALMLPGYAVYDATKGAVEQFTHILAKEFGPRGITVNAVSPGATETETYRAGKSERFLASLEAMSAFGRLGRPAEIAAVVAFWPAMRLVG
jgi:3-oxoacyl-[acyl-carrier protein] reductase